MYDPVLDQQIAMRGSAVGVAPAVDADFAGFDIDDPRISRLLAGMLFGAVATLVLLRAAGFRFSFGVGVNAGS
jgi:hypothetical protein